MLESSLTDTEVGLEKGRAMIEVTQIHGEHELRITADGATARLLKTGLYDVDLKDNQLRVFDGKAFVQAGDEHVAVKGGHNVSLAGYRKVKLKTSKFNTKSYEEGDLYRWSSLRSSYLAEANVDAAALYAESGWGPWGPGWWGANWYWDPYFGAFTFIPADGIFYSAFGWGFYSPWCAYRSPIYVPNGYGYFFRPYYHQFGPDYHNWGPGTHYPGSHQYAYGIYRGAGSVGGFRSGPRTTSGGWHSFGRMSGGNFGRSGFHGGGSFHGGGGGGGSHGR